MTAETDEELIRAYKAAYHNAYWYDGNNPGHQKWLDKQASALAQALVARGLRPADYQQEIRESGGRSPPV
jgi:hypothetical protein